MKPAGKRCLPLAVVAALTALPLQAATDAERIQLLEEKLRMQEESLRLMRQELESLKAGKPAAETAVASQPPAEAPPGATASPEASDGSRGSDFRIYGFVMADAIYDFKRVDPDWSDTLRVSTIPTQAGQYGRDGEFVFSVRQSRLGFSAEQDTEAGKFTALLEAELFGTGGDAGQTTPRLRHAWATWNNLGMGQTWSNFMDADVFPNTIDYWGPTGMVFYRNKQARYTWPLGEDEFAIAIEDPDTALTVGKFRDECANEDGESCQSTLGDLVKKHNDVPDLSLRYRNNTDWGHFQLAGIARKLGYERLDTGARDSEFGWGLNGSTVININDRDRLKLQLVYGEGIGNYMNDGGVDLAPRKATLENNSARTVPLLGIVAYYDHYWNDRWSSSLGWSMTRLDTTIGQADNEFEKGQIAQLNLLHYPADGVMLGGELIWGERVDISGADGYDTRVQFSLKVNFPRDR